MRVVVLSLATSISLSLTVSVLLFTVVVVPLTVRSPPMVKGPVIVPPALSSFLSSCASTYVLVAYPLSLRATVAVPPEILSEKSSGLNCNVRAAEPSYVIEFVPSEIVRGFATLLAVPTTVVPFLILVISVALVVAFVLAASAVPLTSLIAPTTVLAVVFNVLSCFF